MIRNIVFDFGGVVLDWNPHYLYDSYFGSVEKADFFLKEICPYEWNTKHDAGKPIAEGTAERIALFPEWEKEIRMYYDRFLTMIGGPVPGTYEYILDLKERGYRVFGLTNWSAETFRLVRHGYPVFDALEGIVVSGEERVMKPDPRIFNILFDRYSIEAWESIFIDDNEKNVAGACAVGMQGLLFRDADSLRSELDTILGDR